MSAFGCDISNYQSQFSASDAHALANAGHTFLMVGRQQRNTGALQQAAFARAAGLEVGEYLISLGGTWPEPMPETRYIAVDVEPGSEFYTEQDIDNALAWIATTGRTPVIYSSKWAWDALGLAGVTKYGEQGILCWNAHYDGQADGFELPTPYGGWTRCDIDQYTEKGRVYGIDYDLDLNAARDGLFTAAPANDPNHEDGYDTGITRLRLEDMLRLIRDEHAHAEGDPAVLHEIIDRQR